MDALLRRLPLLPALQVAIAATIVLFALGSGSLSGVIGTASRLRWLGLAVVAALAVLLAVSRGRSAPPNRVLFASAAALGALTVLSAAWSVDPRLTLARGVSFLILVVACGALGLAATGDRAAIEAILVAVLAGAVLVCIAGVFVYFYDHAAAVQAGGVGTPARWKGLGQNPNTVPILAALAAPLGLRWLLAGHGWGRAAGAVSFVGLVATIVASGSRGALGAAVVGVAFVGVLLPRGLLRGFALATLLVVFLGAAAVVNDRVVAALRNEQAIAAAAATPPPAKPVVVAGQPTYQPHVPPKGVKVAPGPPGLPRLEDEIGYPNSGAGAADRTFFGSSGRSQAWSGAIEEAARRPLLGYGFGTEDRVFLDRYYYFQGDRPENSYIGLLLQTGAVGALLFLAAGVALLLTVIRGRRDTLPAHGAMVAAAGSALAGFVLAFAQSFVYSVGNIGTITFWLCLFMAAAAAPLASRNPDRRVTGGLV